MNPDAFGETHPENPNNRSPISVCCKFCKNNFDYTIEFDEKKTICPACGEHTPLIQKTVKPRQSVGSFLFIALCLLVGFFSGYLYNYGERLEFNQGEIYYKAPVLKEEVKLVGEALIDQGFFDGRPKSIQLLKKDGLYQIRFVVRENFQFDDGILLSFKQISLLISNQALQGAPIEIHFCDSYFKTKKIIPVKEKLMSFEGGEIFYESPVSADEIKKAGDFFLKIDYFGPQIKPTVLIVKKNRYQFHFVVRKDLDWSEGSSYYNSFKEIGYQLALEIFKGAPFEIRLCDNTLTTFKTIKSDE